MWSGQLHSVSRGCRVFFSSEMSGHDFSAKLLRRVFFFPRMQSGVYAGEILIIYHLS